MTPGVWVAILLALISNAVAFGVTLMRVGAIGQRLDLLWAWYLAEHGFERAVDRRDISPRELRRRGGRQGIDRAADHPNAGAGESTV